MKIQNENTISDPSHHGLAATKANAIAVATNFGEMMEKNIAPIVYGTKLKILFFRLSKKVWRSFKLMCARYQLNDPLIQALSTEKSARWQSQSDYIAETIQRDKLRFYEFRRR